MTDDYFELTELHVRPDAQGAGLGDGLLRALLVGTDRAPRCCPPPSTAGGHPGGPGASTGGAASTMCCGPPVHR